MGLAVFAAASVQCSNTHEEEPVSPVFFTNAEPQRADALALPPPGETPERFTDGKGNRWVLRERITRFAVPLGNRSADLEKPLPLGPSREEMLAWPDDQIAAYWSPVMVINNARYDLEMVPMEFARKWRAGEFFGKTEPLEPKTSELSPQGVIGTDNRLNVTGTPGAVPTGRFSRQILLSAGPIQPTNWSAQCTAGLLGPSVALSAAHCFNNELSHDDYPTYNWASGVATKTTPSTSTQTNAFPVPTYGYYVGCYAYYYPSAFLTNPSVANDFAVMQFTCGVQPGNAVGAHGSYTVSDAQINGSATELFGYPTVRPLAFYQTYYQVPSLVTQSLPAGNAFLPYANANYVKHYLDATGGQSGSPMLQTVSGVQYVTMLHSGEYSSYNVARRFDGTVYGFLKTWTTY